MGTFSVPVEVGDANGHRFLPMEALVDTGATYLVVSRRVLESLGVEPLERGPFSLANGHIVEYDIGLVSLRLEGRLLPVLCVFGDEDSEPLLGAVALESFRLAPDPVGQRLVPVPGRLMGHGLLG